MNLKIISLAIILSVLLAASLSPADTIYTWIDEYGVRHMTNIPPVQSSENLDVIELDSPPIAEEAPAVQYALPEDLPAAGETAVSILDNHVIVPVLLTYKGRQVNARLLLDTGSTNITLHKNMVEKLFITKSQKGSIRVAGGDVIDAEAVILDSVTVGPKTEKNLVAGIIVLKNYQYTIDFKDKVLRWNN